MAQPTPDPNDSSILGYEPPDPDRPASAAPTEAELGQEAPAIGALDHSPARPGHDPYAALRFGTYRLYTIGWMTALVGHMMTGAALGWEIYDRTGKELYLGYLAGIQVIPLVALALPAGVLADRMDRRRIIATMCVLASTGTLGLAWLSYREGWGVHWMFVCVLLSSAANTIGRPARQALLPQIVPTWVFSNAVTWNSSFTQLSAMAGPALAGVVIAHSVRTAYLIDVACTLVFAVMVSRLPRPAAAMRRIHEPVMRSLTRGLRFVASQKIILATLTLDLFAVMLGGAVYLLPVFAKDILGVGAVGFGWMRAAGAIGAFCMAMIIAHMPPMKHAGRTMLLAVAAFGVATVVFGLSRNYWLSLAMLFVMGAVDNVSVVVRHTLVQVLTPDSMRGRVSAVNAIFIGASNEIGGLRAGWTAHLWGAVASVVIGGIGTILSVLAVGAVWPQVRRFGSLVDARPAEAKRAS